MWIVVPPIIILLFGNISVAILFRLFLPSSKHFKHCNILRPVVLIKTDDTPCGSDDGIIAAQILAQFAKDFSKRNPHIRVFNSVIHLDEATPHLHIDFVPFATEQKRGLSTRNSLSKALEQQGFIAKGQFETSSKLWVDNEKQQLAEIMKQYDIEWKQLRINNPHLSVLDYKN